jgi:hypothetical protein
MASPTFPPLEAALVLVHATTGGVPASGVKFQASYMFPANVAQCSGITDASGNGSCSVLVPVAPDGTQVTVAVLSIDPVGGHSLVTTSFVIQRA